MQTKHTSHLAVHEAKLAALISNTLLHPSQPIPSISKPHPAILLNSSYRSIDPKTAPRISYKPATAHSLPSTAA